MRAGRGLRPAARAWAAALLCRGCRAAVPPQLLHAVEFAMDCWAQPGLTWAACCGGPAGNATCWERSVRTPAGDAHRLTHATCCAFSGAATLESLARQAAADAASELLERRSPAQRRLREFAANRTRLARRSRDVARRRLAETSQEDRRRAAKVPAEGRIPVLGWPVAFDPEGLTLRLLRSIDFPVGALVLVAMGSAPHLPRLVEEARLLRPDLRVVRVAENLGCAGGWNEVIHAAPEAPWWLVSSHDVAYPPGVLARVAAQTEAALAREALGRSYAPGLRTFAIRGQPVQAHTLPSFVLTRRAVAAAGLFDENFWPAYAEDDDYFQRLALVGGTTVGTELFLDLSIEIVHGPEDWADGVHYSGVEQFVASPQRSREADAERDARACFAAQLQAGNNYHLHFCRKFGPLGRERCTASDYAAVGPFAVPGARWDDWVLDPARRACSQSAGVAQLCAFDVGALTAA